MVKKTAMTVPTNSTVVSDVISSSRFSRVCVCVVSSPKLLSTLLPCFIPVFHFFNFFLNNLQPGRKWKLALALLLQLLALA